mgnify:FL=1
MSKILITGKPLGKSTIRCVCKECNCVFDAYNSDIYTVELNGGKTSYITCPFCNHKIPV